MNLRRKHLTTLFNTFYDDGLTSIPVKHPCSEIGELLRIELGERHDSTVRFTQGPLSYQQSRGALTIQYDESVVEDLPGEEHYMRALVGGGVADLENREEVRNFIRRHGYRDLASGHHPLFAGIDTNLFPWLPEQLLECAPTKRNRDDKNRPPINGYALSGGVKEELDFYFRHEDDDRLADAFGAEFTRLAGQPASANRQGLLGLYEHRRLLATRTVDEVPGRKGDEAIVDSYRDYHHGNRKHVALFSNDYGFIEYARDNGLVAQHVSFPVDTPRKTTATWREIEDTLYLLTVIFGVLTLPKVTLYGVWPEKDARDWQRETIDVDCRSPVYESELVRRTNIVHAFEDAT